MKKTSLLLSIFALSFLGTCGESPISASEYSNHSDTRNELISKNINHVKDNLCKKIQKAESKLEKYKKNLNNSRDDSGAQIWLKKIHRTEEIINNLNDTLLGMSLAEDRFSK